MPSKRPSHLVFHVTVVLTSLICGAAASAQLRATGASDSRLQPRVKSQARQTEAVPVRSETRRPAASQATAAPYQPDARVVRARVADGSVVALEPDGLTLAPFPDRIQRFAFRRLIEGDATRTWVGTARGHEDSLILTFGDGLAYGRAQMDGLHYELVGIGDELWIVRELDEPVGLPCAGGLVPEPSRTLTRSSRSASLSPRSPARPYGRKGQQGQKGRKGRKQAMQLQAGLQDQVFTQIGARIEVLGVFTPTLRQETFDWLYYYAPFIEGSANMSAIQLGREVMHLVIQNAIDTTNDSLAWSGVTHRLHLVHAAEVQMQEDGDAIEEYLDWVTNEMNTPGTNIQGMRDFYAADLVSLWVADGVDACGIGYRQESILPPNFAYFATSVVDLNCQSVHVFTHEIGHNFGAAHEYGVANDGDVIYPYAYGHTGSNFRTVMSYGDACGEFPDDVCPPLPYFSSPDLSWNGEPMGTASGADNVRTLNQTGWGLAAHR